jgi:hypothetical protein
MTDKALAGELAACSTGSYGFGEQTHRLVPYELCDRILAALSPPASETDCPSCGGLNTSCPDGCGRDSTTGELNGTQLSETGDAVERRRKALAQAIYRENSLHTAVEYGRDIPDHALDSILATLDGLARAAIAATPADGTALLRRGARVCLDLGNV